jgi:anti-sigma-K factor RskA
MALASTLVVALLATLLVAVLRLDARLGEARSETAWLQEALQQQRVVSYLALTPGTEVIFLDDTQGGWAKGMLMLPPQGQQPVLVAFGLPRLPAAKAYQLWLIRDGTRYSGGLFNVDKEGYGLLQVASPIALKEIQQGGITIEPAGGSPGPTGLKVLGGSRK